MEEKQKLCPGERRLKATQTCRGGKHKVLPKVCIPVGFNGAERGVRLVCLVLAARKLQQKRTILLEEEAEEDEMIKQVPEMSMQSTVIIEGVEYKIERLNGRSSQAPATR